MGEHSITAEIAAFGANARLSIPDSALAVARLSLMDWLAVAMAGLDEPVARMTRALAEEEAGVRQATAFGLEAKVPTRAAALVNGALSHALDYDDTHFAYVGHPSVAVFPAALAMAERQGASVNAFVEAALVGMEAACRIGSWLGTRHYNHGFHQTATAGAFGATIAAGRLLGLDAERMRHALGIAATRASGLKSQFGTMGKPLNAGIAASNGVEASLLAAQGFVSRPDGLECVQGFGDTHAGECGDPAEALDRLGKTFWFESVQHKFHACCHGTHAALDALAALRTRHKLTPDAVESVTLRVNPRWLRVCDIPKPRTGLEAKFSYRLTTAMALAGLETGALDVWSEATCADARLVRIRDSVEVIGDPAVADTAARVTVISTDGTMGTFVDLDAPMTIDERRGRVVAKVRALLPADAAETVVSLIEQGRDLRASGLAEAIGALANRASPRTQAA